MSRGDGVKLWTGNELSASPLLDYKTIFLTSLSFKLIESLREQ